MRLKLLACFLYVDRSCFIPQLPEGGYLGNCARTLRRRPHRGANRFLDLAR